ncbi:MAG: 2-oxoacid:ferredoxin oxidoreductase subunit beta [Candidatus Bathyarchaeota archaeon]|nr:MAG: 2-oxoacid:ferredoxin oxidoreductase subunit beta [Candidatus Bathyarchaeota archaeon]
MTEAFTVREYLRDIKLPFCAGCGCVTVISHFLRAAYELGHKDLSKFVFCSGIGCAAWIPSPHFKADSIHTTHGRSIPAATGIKLMRPDLNVVVFGGDGDIAGIGLSHLIHAARRNLDIIVVMVNNMIYGMTGGQVAPTTPLETKTTTTPYGSFENPLDVPSLVVTAGASYAARWTTIHGEQLKEALKKALTTKGFAFVEAVSPCPTAFGKRAGFEDVAEIIRWLRENSLSLEEAEKMAAEDLVKKIVVGEYVDRESSTFTEAVYKTIQKAEKSAKKK